MLPTRNPTFDRILFAAGLLSAWTLPSIFVWAFTKVSDMPSWWNYAGLVCAGILYFTAYVMTFTIGGLRYVLTGSEFPEDRT